MSPFEVARLKAAEVRAALSHLGINLSTGTPALVQAACKHWGLKVRRLAATNPLLNEADANIDVEQREIFVRKGIEPPLEAFLLAHELGHFFLHRAPHTSFIVGLQAIAPDVDGSAAIRYVEAYGPRERQELQANVFAREFLLPRSLAKDLFLVTEKSASAIATDLAVPLEIVRLQLFDALLLPSLPPSVTSSIPKTPTDAQKPAVNSPHQFTLVEAGPGTGKTTTLLLRLRKLLDEGAEPTGIVVLTFSNKAARELVERLKAASIKGAERVWVGTFHSFGLEFLRKFGTLCGLQTQINLLDPSAALSMLEDVLPTLPLRQFDPLSDPINWLPSVLSAIARCKDDLLGASEYRREVVTYPDKDADRQGKRLDAATLFEVYEFELTKRHAVDFNDLLGKTVALLGRDDEAIEVYLHGIEHVLVDEYQDVNRASARLVALLSKYAKTLWAVGDAHQAIYGFMGASSRNMTDFKVDFPGAVVIPLGDNHRSTQEITDAFHTVSTRAPNGKPALHLHAQKGAGGEPPEVILCSDDTDEIDVLAGRIMALQDRIPYSQQAVIVGRNERATEIAQGLERRGIPVLYLGNIYERPEIKELLCLLHLSVDDAGVALGSDWQSLNLAAPLEDVAAFLSNVPDEDDVQPWWERDLSKLSHDGQKAIGLLRELTTPLRELISPWDALCSLLLEDGRILRTRCAGEQQQSINARLAIWQFVHSCRTPDGLTQYATVRNLFERVRRRIKLGQEKSLRHVPPEAEGLNALRVLTVHASKGLEFDVIHFAQATKNVYEVLRKDRQWALIPPETLERLTGVEEQAARKLERHNLLYVGLSRARLHLYVYQQKADALPSALDGVFRQAGTATARIPMNAADEMRAPLPPPKTITLEDLIQFKSACPRRVEFSRRLGRVSSGNLPVYRLMDVAAARSIKHIALHPETRDSDSIEEVVKQHLTAVDLWEHPHAKRIAQRLITLTTEAANAYQEGGAVLQTVDFQLGEVAVSVNASQVLGNPGKRKIRLMRNRDSQFKRAAQALGVLTLTHHEATGERVIVEGLILSDGRRLSPTNVKADTVVAFRAAGQQMVAGQYAPNASVQTCPLCTYFVLCHQGKE